MSLSFHYVPAGILHSYCLGLGLYVRYHPVTRPGIEAAQINQHTVLVQAPDRDLLFQSHWHESDPGSRPLDEHWDEILVFSPYYATVKDFGIKYAMSNFLRMATIKHLPMHQYMPRKDGICWLGDSGGYQISTGQMGYIDAEHVAEHYIQQTDVGISLDVPVGNLHDLLPRSAKVQKGNNDAMLALFDRKGGPVPEIMNVIHGSTEDQVEQFHTAIHDPRIRRISVANIPGENSLSILNKLASFMELTAGQYDHYHMLGVFNPLFLMTLLRYLHKQWPNTLFTSDSTSGIQGIHTMEYSHWPNHDAMIGSINISHRNSYMSAVQNYDQIQLPCGCPICSRVKYAALVEKIPLLAYFMRMHNALEMVRYVEFAKTQAATLDDSNYLKFVTQQIGKKPRRLRAARQGLEFVSSICEHGRKRTARNFSLYTAAGGVISSWITPEEHLFASPDDLTPAKVGEQTYRQHVEETLDKHEAFQGGTRGKRQVKTNKERINKGHKHVSNSKRSGIRAHKEKRSREKQAQRKRASILLAKAVKNGKNSPKDSSP